jgi:CheY-like chemotaxis protein
MGAWHMDRGPMSILIVDPDFEARRRYRQGFESAGCIVVEASDGRDALTKALGQRPSLVVTEIQLPFIDGFALCELLRSDAATADVPILVVTSEQRPVQLDRAKRAGARAVLTKAASADDVLRAARTLIALPLVLPTSPHRVLSKAHARYETANPPTSPPPLTCPSCDTPLTYDHSHVGGVSDRHPEQWDYYRCSWCGTFQYRQRTRKLRHVS